MITLLLTLALTAAAPAETADPVVTTQPAKPEKPKKICKSIKMTGSTIGKRICKTEEQWLGEQSANIDVVNQSYKQNIGNDGAGLSRGN